MEKQNITNIDIAKLFFAYCIIGLHSGVFLESKYGYYIHSIIFRLGVPVFFICSGYFLAGKTTAENKTKVILQYIKKLFVPYFLWNAFYVPYSLHYAHALNGYNLMNGIFYTLTGRSQTVMWFVGTLIWSAVILLHIRDEKKLKPILLIFAGLYVVGLLFNTYLFVVLNVPHMNTLVRWLTDTFRSNSDVFFCGFLFTGMGYYLKKFGEPKNFRSLRNLWFAVIVSAAVLVGEAWVVKRHLDVVMHHEYFLAHLVLVPAIFLILKTIPQIKISTKPIRTLSTHIYYGHFAALYAVIAITNYTHWKVFNSSIFSYLIVAFSITVFCLIYESVMRSVKQKEKLSMDKGM